MNCTKCNKEIKGHHIAIPYVKGNLFEPWTAAIFSSKIFCSRLCVAKWKIDNDNLHCNI